MLLLVTACGSKDPYERRAQQDLERRERAAKAAVKKAPDWMTELPRSSSAIYANGTAVSSDMGMSAHKAKAMAYGKICMAAGGRVNQSSRIFRTDTEDHSAEHSELAIQTVCPNVDISGVETVDIQYFVEGGRVRTFVLVALPTGKANQIQSERRSRELQNRANTRSQEAFREMPSDAARPQ